MSKTTSKKNMRRFRNYKRTYGDTCKGNCLTSSPFTCCTMRSRPTLKSVGRFSLPFELRCEGTEGEARQYAENRIANFNKNGIS